MIDALTQPVELPLLVVLVLLAYTPERLVRAVGAVRSLPGALARGSRGPDGDKSGEM
jgi:hypothetical protein